MKLVLGAILVLAACSVAVNSQNVTSQRRVCTSVAPGGCTKMPGATSPVVKSGQQVAIKMPYRNHWLGCAGRWCSAASCPARFFTTSKSRCWGEVFTIYSRLARGRPIKVGDQVGLYFNKHKKWFGCPHRYCSKYKCPGRPNFHYGMQHPSKWRKCGGEIFKIYAMGKCNGQNINHKDAIMLRAGSKWVSLWARKTDKRTCPGNSLPPPPNKYDKCAGEAMEIFKI